MIMHACAPLHLAKCELHCPLAPVCLQWQRPRPPGCRQTGNRGRTVGEAKAADTPAATMMWLAANAAAPLAATALAALAGYGAMEQSSEQDEILDKLTAVQLDLPRLARAMR